MIKSLQISQSHSHIRIESRAGKNSEMGARNDNHQMSSTTGPSRRTRLAKTHVTAEVNIARQSLRRSLDGWIHMLVTCHMSTVTYSGTGQHDVESCCHMKWQVIWKQVGSRTFRTFRGVMPRIHRRYRNRLKWNQSWNMLFWNWQRKPRFHEYSHSRFTILKAIFSYGGPAMNFNDAKSSSPSKGVIVYCGVSLLSIKSG